MIRRELTAAVAGKLDLSAATVGQVLDTALELLLDGLVRTGRLEWRGFGTFAVRAYASRKINNPSTGQIITLPERKSVTFKPSAHLRARLKTKRRSTPRTSR